MIGTKQAAGVPHLSAFLGLDVGWVNTRATLFGISAGYYQVLASNAALTTRAPGVHIGAGAGKALRNLQADTEHFFLEESGGLLMPFDRIGRGVDRVALVVSAGRRIRSGVLGVSTAGSFEAGRILCDSLPLDPVCDMSLIDLHDEKRCIETLVKNRPDVLVIAGGEDNGETASIKRWIEITRTACSLLPKPSQPLILYAGNPLMEAYVRRRLEPVTNMRIVPNIQPLHGQYDLAPAQYQLEQEILRLWQHELNGLTELCDLTMDLYGIGSSNLERMVRFLSLLAQNEQTKQSDPDKSMKTGVLSIDLGGMYTTAAVGMDGLSGSVVQDKFTDLTDPGFPLGASQAIYQWAGEGVSRDDADQFLCNHALMPAWVPETREELGLSQAYARFRLRRALEKLADNYDWFDYHPDRGLFGRYQQIILSGAVVTNAPSVEGLFLALLDGLQPWGITTMVVDRHQLLPLLGKIGETEPILPVHILASPAFENLGTVISVAGDLRKGKPALTVHVETAAGEAYTVEISQGDLKRLDVPAGESVVLEFMPQPKIDVGFGGPGQGGQLRLTGGSMGVVIDARGRPIGHIGDDADRAEEQVKWLRELGVENA